MHLLEGDEGKISSNPSLLVAPVEDFSDVPRLVHADVVVVVGTGVVVVVVVVVVEVVAISVALDVSGAGLDVGVSGSRTSA